MQSGSRNRGSVLECSSPLELFAGRDTLESAGGPAQSRTLPRVFTQGVNECLGKLFE
jgi:hypothetical protein